MTGQPEGVSSARAAPARGDGSAGRRPVLLGRGTHGKPYLAEQVHSGMVKEHVHNLLQLGAASCCASVPVATAPPLTAALPGQEACSPHKGACVPCPAGTGAALMTTTAVVSRRSVASLQGPPRQTCPATGGWTDGRPRLQHTSVAGAMTGGAWAALRTAPVAAAAGEGEAFPDWRRRGSLPPLQACMGPPVPALLRACGCCQQAIA